MRTSDDDFDVSAFQLSSVALSPSSAEAPPPTGELSALALGINISEGGDTVGIEDAAASSLQVKPEGENITGFHAILINTPSSLCRGQIGETGLKFCCDEVGQCPIVVHQQRKSSINPGIYTKEKGSYVAFTQPRLDVTGLDIGVVEDLLKMNTSLKEVQNELTLVSNQQGTTKQEIDTAARKALKAAKGYKTPAKFKMSAEELNPSNLTGLTSALLTAKAKGLSVKTEGGMQSTTDTEAGESVSPGTVARLFPNFAGVIDNLEVKANTLENLLN